ncbi:MAG: DUF3467 domain-containing protein [Bradymonadales bacterium]|nr:DUF3467 domain-containing protein [Bradymonadales bacterium]
MSEQKPDEKGPNEPPKIRITFAEGQVDGRYVNLALVSHTPTEFILDFAYIPPGLRDAKVLARVILNPVIAKRFLRAMTDNLARYENRFGEVDINLGGPEPTLH